MAPSDSQAPDSPDLDQSLDKLLPAVSSAVRYACRVHNHHADRDEIRDLCQDVFLLLFKDDSRVLRSFAGRSSLETWLYAVVRHCVGQYLWKRRRDQENVNLDDLSPDALIYQATQEEALNDDEAWEALRAIAGNLPERKRRLMELALQGLKPDEIAKEMEIKVSSVYREKSALFKEIRKLLEGR